MKIVSPLSRKSGRLEIILAKRHYVLSARRLHGGRIVQI